jgi:hypothetical protein
VSDRADRSVGFKRVCRAGALILFAAVAALSPGPGGAARSGGEWDLWVASFHVGPTRGILDGHYSGKGRAVFGVYELKKGLRFSLMTEFTFTPGLRSTAPGAVTVRYVLPAGLHFGEIPPEPRGIARTVFPPWGWSFTPGSQSCTIQGQEATCQVIGGIEVGTTFFGWLLDVVADGGGSYRVRAEIVAPAPAVDITPSNNQASFDVVITQGASAPVRVTPVRIVRPRPSLVQASVQITTDKGLPVAPKNIRCRTSFGMPKIISYPGYVRCSTLFNNSTYKGRTLRGTLSFTANGRPITVNFSRKV